MNLHEYQAKALFTRYGVPVPPGEVVHSVEEGLRHAEEQNKQDWVVKAQVHAGGRGKAGGVVLVHDQGELETALKKLLGARLVTHQSGPNGQPVNCVLLQSLSLIKSELYLGMLVDRQSRRVTVMASTEGGVDIETVAASQPEKIITMQIDPLLGLDTLQEYRSRRVGFALGLDAEQRAQLGLIIKRLCRLFVDKDLSLVEINPLIVNHADRLEALDAKVTVDDNALYRQPKFEEWRDPSQEDEKENRARGLDLNYVTLDGNIACMVNGAGLAMATMDIIKLHGGEPANFLDVGGDATAERVTQAFKLIISDPNVRAILVNIFGGIVRCDLIAEGIIKAAREVGVGVPIVARLEGTNVEAGRALLADSQLEIITAEGLTDAAEKVVAAAGGQQ